MYIIYKLRVYRQNRKRKQQNISIMIDNNTVDAYQAVQQLLQRQ